MIRKARYIFVACLALVLLSGCQPERLPIADPVYIPRPSALHQGEQGGADGKWESLLDQNDELIGWIKVSGTTIDYPVMQSGNNYKYLSQNFYGEYSAYGTPFIDCDCSIDPLCSNVVLYGHASRSGALFAQLDAYLDAGYAIQNKTIEFSTIYETYSCTIFAVFKAPVSGADLYDYTQCQFISDAEFLEFVGEAKQRSVVAFDTPIESGDHILTIQTCSFDGYGERLVIMARIDT